MLFNSVEFLFFFAIVYGLYCCLQHRAQNWLLLGASYLFYGWWDYRFLSLILISTIIDYFVGLAIAGSRSDRRRRQLVAVSLVSNLGMLGAFKYLGFFTESLHEALSSIGVSLDVRVASLVLPVGISFYTFQTLSYTLDVYRRRLEPTRDFLNFAVFVAFFPQLVAGPIERARHLLPQVERQRTLDASQLGEAAWLILLGYYKKVVLADNMAPFTRRMFESPESVHGVEVLIGVYAFAFQIYGDFSGYSDIARGTAKALGFDLMHNFRMPYFAVHPSDFWRRWHVSLSTWLRDYLYIGLGGNRNGLGKTYRNLMLTMLLGGLWHGAAWNFVAWGLFHGTILCLHRAITRPDDKPRATRPAAHVIKVIAFFHVTCFGWLLFGVKQLEDVPTLLGSLVSPFAVNGAMMMLTVATFAAPVLLLDFFQLRGSDMLVVRRGPIALRLAVYVGLFATLLLAGATGAQQFIYFQF